MNEDFWPELKTRAARTVDAMIVIPTRYKLLDMSPCRRYIEIELFIFGYRTNLSCPLKIDILVIFISFA